VHLILPSQLGVILTRDFDMSDLLALASMILSVVCCIGGYLFIKNRELAWKARHDELSARINLLVLEESRHRRSVSEVLDEREVTLEHEVRQMQSDMKMLDLQLRSGPSRDAPEAVELAIQLARAGESREVVASRTGLAPDIVDFITEMHSSRPKV
jgi:hypothetical protein